MTAVTCRLAFALSSILLAVAPPAAAVDPSAAIKDFSDARPAELGVGWVEEKRDPKTGFKVGGQNETSFVMSLTELNGQPIELLQQRMRPGGDSEMGFLGPDEKLLDVLAADNEFVNEQRLTHQQLARALRLLTAIGCQQPGKEFLYRGRRYCVSLRYCRGYQDSPFDDGTMTSGQAFLENLSNGQSIDYSLLVPDMIERYGFYEGRGTPYRVEPKQILEVCNFLLDENSRPL